MTYVRTAQGWLYLVVVLDLYSRAVVGWAMHLRMQQALVHAALEMAVARRQPKTEVLLHSDRGSQCCAYGYQALLRRHWLRDRPLSLDMLAEIARMSRRTFTRRFRDATGSTVSKWLNAERVLRAQQLLETTDLPIELIADDAGFGAPLSLGQQFSSHLGTSPSEHRRVFFEIRDPARRQKMQVVTWVENP